MSIASDIINSIWKALIKAVKAIINFFFARSVKFKGFYEDHVYNPINLFIEDVSKYYKDQFEVIKTLWGRYGWLSVSMKVLQFFAGKYLTPIWNWYNKEIKPTVIYIQGWIKEYTQTIDKLKKMVETGIRNDIDLLIRDTNQLRKDMVKISTALADVAQIFDKKLAEKIRVVRDEWNRALSAVTVDFKDFVLKELHKVTDPLSAGLSKVTETVKTIVDPFHKLAQAFKDIIPPTIEKPALLTRQTMKYTGKEYGADFLDAAAEAGTPETTPQERQRISTLKIDKIITEQISEINKGKKGIWGDLYQCIDEEIQEISTGKPLEQRKEISLPGVKVEIG